MKLPTIKELSALLQALKSEIDDEYRASDDPDDGIPGMQVTVGCNTATGAWSWQTGDNSYTGGAYGYPTWGVVSLYRRSNCVELARDIRAQIEEQCWGS